MGVLYILDEPSIGLHQRDNDKLIATLKRLRDLGNTLIVVEHDDDTILAADYVVDIGPGAAFTAEMWSTPAMCRGCLPAKSLLRGSILAVAGRFRCRKSSRPGTETVSPFVAHGNTI